jgi:phosphatidylglycerol:prolipoprotein diacylglycerol transferase
MDFFAEWSDIPAKISPVIFSIGSFHIRWYPVCYLLSFIIAYLFVIRTIKAEKLSYSKQYIAYLFSVAVISAVIGGRIGYVLFYDFDYYRLHPLKIFFPFDISNHFAYTGLAGLSFHGSVLAIILAAVIIARIDKVDFWRPGDIIMTAVPLGYTFGRLGNFLNGELYGRVTSSPLGMYFPIDPSHQLRHPSQLYEAFFEGLVLFLILWSIKKIKTFDGLIFSLYLIGYGLARFCIEFFRQPDPQLGFVLKNFTMGQLLSVVMILAGVCIGIIRFIQTKKISFITQ